MKTLNEFKASLNGDQPHNDLPIHLKSLWHDAKGDWHRAHAQVDHLSDTESAWVHAYLHRKEGDMGNADYWYRIAGKESPAIALDKEWEILATYFLK